MKECLLEKTLKACGFVLVHDGQRSPEQIELPPEDVACFTRKYRWKIDGEFVNTWAVFIYDDRSELADFEIYSREPGLRGREKVTMSIPETREPEVEGKTKEQESAA